MGRYVDWDFLATRYPHVERAAGADTVNSYHVPYAEAELDGRLASRYTVPFSSDNLTAKEIAADLVYLRLGLLKSEDRDAVRQEVDARISRLLRGDEVMASVGDTIQPSGEAVWSDNQGYSPMFDVDDPQNWEVSSERLDDIEDRRDG
jgi:hypothetical protein